MRTVEELTPAPATRHSTPFFERNASHHFFETSPDPDSFFQKSSPSPFIQPKLTIGQPNDKYEQEADAVAQKVVSSSETAIQTKCTECEKEESLQKQSLPEEEELQMQPKEEEEEMLQTQSMEEEEGLQMKPSLQLKNDATSAGRSEASSGIQSRINNNRGSGWPLDSKARGFMESRMQTDFSSVNIHTNDTAVQMNRELGARAFTVGSDIYFNKGEYRPETTKGKKLLAHELTHVVQQQNTLSPAIQRTIGDGFDLSSPRFKGDPDLEACFDSEKIIKVGSSGESVRKIQQALIDAGFPLPRFGTDGIFGQETKASVREFQRQSGLEFTELDGDVGSTTISRLDSRFTGSSAISVEQTCESGIKTVVIDVVMMRGSNGNPVADIAFANSVFSSCCMEFQLGSMVTMPTAISDSLLGGDTDFLVGDCGEVSAEDLPAFITANILFGLTNPIIAFYVDTLHEGGTRLRGVSVSPLCATGSRAPLEGMMAISNGSGSRTFPHELAHILMNTFADHNVTADNLQQVSSRATGEKIAPVQCAIMYTRV